MTFLAGHVQDFQTTDDERQTRLLTRELRVSQGNSSGNSTKKKQKKRHGKSNKFATALGNTLKIEHTAILVAEPILLSDFEAENSPVELSTPMQRSN